MEQSYMSESTVPRKTTIRLWGKAAGRCEYEGCNEPLWLDSLTKSEFNMAYLAHIIADKAKGPRGNAELSKKLKNDISNLMLLCDKHHRLIDKEDVVGHPVERLRLMKRKHEERIELHSSVMEDKQSHIILYGSNIGEHSAQISWEKASQSMQPVHYPASHRAIELSLKNNSARDDEKSFWKNEREHLKKQYNEFIKPRLSSGEVQHFSVFALAPQPLLVELGRLISDIPGAEVYQLHREPPDWKWQGHPQNFKYVIFQPQTRHHDVAINLSLSATIDDSRIASVLNVKHSIWKLTHENPNNDFLKSRTQLQEFRENFRVILNRIKAVHGEKAIIHLFPAVPNSVAVDIGRVWMQKADLPIRIYEQNSKKDGFTKTFDLTHK